MRLHQRERKNPEVYHKDTRVNTEVSYGKVDVDSKGNEKILDMNSKKC